MLEKRFDDKKKLIDLYLTINPNRFAKCGYSTSCNKGALIEKDYTYFKPNIILENKKMELNGDYYIKLLGKFDCCAFINYFVNSIIKKYKDSKEPCFIKPIENTYKCYIEFQKDEEDNEDNKNELKDLKIKLELYRSGEEELILIFLRKSGDKHEYNE